MATDSDIEFARALRALVLSPEETLRRNALRDKISAGLDGAFDFSCSEDNPFEIASTQISRYARRKVSFLKNDERKILICN